MPERGAGVRTIEPQHKVALPEFTWDTISEPGAYVEVGSGDLYRIPQEALVRGSSPMIRKDSLGANRFIQLSKDPFLTTLEARMVSAEHNIQPNF